MSSFARRTSATLLRSHISLTRTPPTDKFVRPLSAPSLRMSALPHFARLCRSDAEQGIGRDVGCAAQRQFRHRLRPLTDPQSIHVRLPSALALFAACLSTLTCLLRPGGRRVQRTLAAHSRRSREHPFRCMPVSPVDRNSCLRAFNHLNHLANCRLQPDCIDELGCAGDSWALPGLRRPGLVGLGAHLPRLYHRHPSLW